MAAWLFPIVCGDEIVVEHPSGNGEVDAAGVTAAGVQQVPAKAPSKQSMEKVRARATEGKCTEVYMCMHAILYAWRGLNKGWHAYMVLFQSS